MGLQLRGERMMIPACNARAGMVSIPLVVESYGGWGHEAVTTFASLSKAYPSAIMLNELLLFVHLMRQNAQELLAHALPTVAFVL